ncbi:MAG: hypothetical protein RLZZ326_346 [Planctomycetota bacterium]
MVQVSETAHSFQTAGRAAVASDRAALENLFARFAAEHPNPETIPRPPNWGGISARA